MKKFYMLKINLKTKNCFLKKIKGELRMKKIIKKGIVFAFALLFFAPVSLLFAACGETISKVSTYNELVEALNGTSDIVQLANDIDVPSEIFVNRKVTLDLNGKTLFNSNDIWNLKTNQFSILGSGENGDLTITGNGKIIAKKDDCYGVDARDGGKLVIENTEIVGNVTSVYSYEGDVEIRSGTFSIQQLSENFGHKLLINLYDQNRDAGKTTLKVYGGTYVGFDPANPMENGYKLLPEGYSSTLIDEATNTYKVTMS